MESASNKTAVAGAANAGLSAGDQCGNEFNTLKELIWWLIHHRRGPHPPGPDPWNELTQIAQGMQQMAIAIRFAEKNVRGTLAANGAAQATNAINRLSKQLLPQG
jgi:hypothetical protein